MTMKVQLTVQEKQTLLAQHVKTRDGRIRDRIKSVIHASNGWSPDEIAEALLIHETTVRQHLKDYHGSNKLKPENGGSHSYLNALQTHAIIAHISEHTYRYTYQIVAYIFQRYGIQFSISGLNKWLHKNGFSYKQPKGVPHKFDEKKQAEFIDYYNDLKSTAALEPILFMDATHPTQATKVSGGWIKKGHDKAIKTTGSRTRINLIGAINLTALASAHVTRFDKVNSDSNCER